MSIANQIAQIVLKANSSQLPAGLARAGSMISSFASGAAKVLGKLNIGPKNLTAQKVMERAAGHVAGGMAMRGLDILVDQGQKVFDFEEALTRLGIAGRIAVGDLGGIRSAINQLAPALGVDRNAILANYRAYIDLAGAQSGSIEKMKILARAGQATGAEGKDLAGLMYQLTRSMKITDAQMEDTIGGLVEQAKDGKIEAKQMAAEFSAILPLLARFKGGTGRDAVNMLGAMFQTVADNFNSASEAGTGMVRMLASLRTYAGRFEAHGIKIWDTDEKGFKHARELRGIIDSISQSDLAKDPQLLKKAFGRTEGWRSIEMLFDSVQRMKDLEEVGKRNGVIQKDLATYMESASGRMASAFEKMKVAVAEAFTPERISRFVDAIEGLATKVAPLVDMVGHLGDALGAIYNAGKTLREFLTPDDSKLADATIENIKSRAAEKGISEADAARDLQAEHGAYLKARQQIIAAMAGGEKNTPLSNKLALAALNADENTPGSQGARLAGMQYMADAKISKDEIDRLNKQIADERLLAANKAGGARSTMGDDALEVFNQALQNLAPAIGRSVADAMRGAPPAVLKLDGNPVARSARDATDRRRQ